MSYFAEKIITFYEDQKLDLSTLKIAVWGLTFKPKTDDIREAPALAIIEQLLGRGISVHVFDPIGMPNTREVLGDRVAYAKDERDSYGVLEGADGLAIITEWNMFKSPALDRMKSLMKSPVVFDGRNILNPPEMRAQGFTYFGIGR
jgi:UDPglucose 6-dehydrogenase